MLPSFPPATEFPCAASGLANSCSGRCGGLKSGRDECIFPSFPPATEIPCVAYALATNASGSFRDLKSRRDERYDSLISDGYRTSLCGL
jgi:hypothetical protein